MPILDHVPGPSRREDRRRISHSLVGLVVGNLLLIAAYLSGWTTLSEVLWMYWLQSVVIGLFHFFRIWKLERFTTAGLSMNGRPVPETPRGKRQIAVFFAVHWGIFHLVYASFLSFLYRPGEGLLWLIPAGAGLLLGEWSAYARHRRSDSTWSPNLGTVSFQPYVRIFPMHLALVAVGAAGLIFLPLKLAADVGMYLADERLDAKRARAQRGLVGGGAVAARR